MPNLALSQTVATAFFDRFLQADRKAKLLFDVLQIFQESAVYVLQDGGYTTAGVRQITAWSLAGVKLDETNRNTDASGRLYVRITANGGNWDIHVYKALAAASEVMTATNIVAGATATLAAANSSGMTGTCVLGASPAAIAADTYSLKLFLGFNEMDRQVFDGTNSNVEDGEIKGEHEKINAAAVSALQGLITRLNRVNEGGAHLKQMSRVWQVPNGTGFISKDTEDNDGVIAPLIKGALPLVYTNMDENTTEQKVAVNTIAAASATEQISGGGDIAVTFGTPGPNLEPGLLQAVCVEDTLPDQKFQITFTPTDGRGAIVGQKLLTVGKAWDDPNIPIQITAVNVYALVDDNSETTENLAAASNFSFVGVTSENSDDGKLYWTVTASGGSWIAAFYKDSSRTQKVAQSPATATDGAFTATQQNRSGLTVVGKIGSSPVTGRTGTMDMQPLKKQTSTLQPDMFTSVISRSAKGAIQDAMREFHGWKLFQGSAPTIPDTLLAKSGAFVDGNP